MLWYGFHRCHEDHTILCDLGLGFLKSSGQIRHDRIHWQQQLISQCRTLLKSKKCKAPRHKSPSTVTIWTWNSNQIGIPVFQRTSWQPRIELDYILIALHRLNLSRTPWIISGCNGQVTAATFDNVSVPARPQDTSNCWSSVERPFSS